jgi:hypothetical protein
VRIGPTGQTLAEFPAARADAENSGRCVNIPVIPMHATCANPHGIQARTDLNILVTADFAEPRQVVMDPLKAQDWRVFRSTVRTFDITNRSNPKLLSVSFMPDGPRKETNPMHDEATGIMEVTVTQQKNHRGAFASSMCGGVLYYAPDITVPNPEWREVFDTTAASLSNGDQFDPGGGCSGSGWVQTSPDDHYLFHAVIGGGPGIVQDGDRSASKQVMMLDIRKLVAAGKNVTCTIDTLAEVAQGGAEKDCPKLLDSYKVNDNTNGGPHWGAMDNFRMGSDGYYHEISNIKRIAFSDSFVSRADADGNHQVCILDIQGDKFVRDDRFVDENTGTPCVQFNRISWPHGDFGDAKPHVILFVVPDADLR